MTRRLFGPVVLGLAVAGAVALVAVRATWASTTVKSAGLPDVEVTVAGSDIAPGVAAMALLVIAAGVGILAAGPRLRWLIGVLVVLASLAGFFQSVLTEGNATLVKALEQVAASGADVRWQGSNARLYAAAAFCVSGALGLVVVLFGHRWATMGSKYESPAVRELDSPDMWRAMDDGLDPTDEPPSTI
ncbi:MAG TPA: Trp biosynthesis-associated membrane protein [Aeromicrobium sp.]|nr:Trp biosynthesis-associated membrane protein [Aeromicrobium sp.]